MKRVFARALAKANVHHITFYALKDTAISQAIASGADVVAKSRIAGHANPSNTLNVYGHILKDSMGSIQRALDETYADMRSGDSTQKQDLPSAS